MRRTEFIRGLLLTALSLVAMLTVGEAGSRRRSHSVIRGSSGTTPDCCCPCLPTCNPACDHPPPDQCPRVRRNIAQLSASQLEALQHGIEVMKARDVSDPTSWAFQANIHGTSMMPPDALWNQCRHGSVQFLVWHRGYLYYLERILREASGDDSLTLPYWDWSTQASLPEPFRLPGDATNPLFDATRNINDGSSLPSPVVVDATNDALADPAFYDPATGSGFSYRLEGTPHGSVHVLIGGNMSAFATAGQDPIFWLHHCNIDRLWNKWLAAGGTNPGDSGFLDEQYKFVDETGATVTRKVREILNSADLCYVYDDVPNVPGATTKAPIPIVDNSAAAVANEVVLATSEPADAANAEPHQLGYSRLTVKLSASEEDSPKLKALMSTVKPGQAETLVLRVRGIQFAEVPTFTYGVYLELPEAAESPAEMKPHFVGAINFFGKNEKHGDHGDEAAESEGFDAEFPLNKTVTQLRAAKKLSDDVSVTLVPLAPVPLKGNEAAAAAKSVESAERAKMTYQSIDLRSVVKRPAR